MNSTLLLQTLHKKTESNRNRAKQFLSFPYQDLCWRPKPNSWNILECLEHLNLYSEFYLSEIKRKISNSRTTPSKIFYPGLLGEYFANSLLYKPELNKMKTFKSKNPINCSLNRTTIDRFIAYQDQTLDLLKRAENISLNKIKVATSINKWIQLKLGDIFRVVVYHNERHIIQASKITQVIN